MHSMLGLVLIVLGTLVALGLLAALRMKTFVLVAALFVLGFPSQCSHYAHGQEADPTEEQQADADVVQWEKESRNIIPHTKKKVPAAETLVRKANALLQDAKPTCQDMS